MQSDSTLDEAPKNKTPRIRSVAYPSYNLDFCIELTKKIDAEFTDVVYTPKEDIIKQVGVAGGGFLMQLSSCVQYGLLELNKGEGYKPTELFKKIKKPLPTENVADFYKQCLLSPELYKKLIGEFKDKQLPSISGLSNILDRMYGVKGGAAELAAKIFFRNLESLELIGAGNILKLEGGITPIEQIDEHYDNPDREKEKPLLLLPPGDINPPANPHIPDFTKTIEIPIFLNNGGEAKIILPKNFTEDDMRRVAKVINAYLP